MELTKTVVFQYDVIFGSNQCFCWYFIEITEPKKQLANPWNLKIPPPRPNFVVVFKESVKNTISKGNIWVTGEI
jgi:hypothetical protein